MEVRLLSDVPWSQVVDPFPLTWVKSRGGSSGADHADVGVQSGLCGCGPWADARVYLLQVPGTLKVNEEVGKSILKWVCAKRG